MGAARPAYAPGPVVLVLGCYAWFLGWLWLGHAFRPRPDWSPRLDGLALGLATYAGAVVAARVVAL